MTRPLAFVLALLASAASAQTIHGGETRYRTFRWINDTVSGCGAVTSCTHTVATLPARTIVERAYVVVTGQGAGPTTLTVSVGRTSTDYVDYVVASNAKAAANTIYGDGTAEIGTNLSALVGDIPSLTGTTDIVLRFVSTGANLSTVTGSTGEVLLETRELPRAASDPVLLLTAPTHLQVVQRDVTTGDITISGRLLRPGTHSVEAKYGSGSWTTVATDASGTFSGTLTGPVGNAKLEVRQTGTWNSAEANDVAIGEVLIVAGQSNASGFFASNQAYTSQQPGRLFGNDYTWKTLADPTDDPTGQVDGVSKDASGQSGAKGSPWPRVASLMADALEMPVAIVPTAMGGTSSTQWQPGANHFNRGTLYGSMAHRAQQTGARVVLWWLGESDAINGVSQAAYNANLDTIANAVQADLGVKLLVAQLQQSSGIADGNEAVIRAAITEAIGDNANVLAGPDLSDLATDDLYHLTTNQNAATVAARWWASLQTAFGW